MNFLRTLFYTKVQVVCVTTFRQGSLNNPVERIRSEVFLDTAKYLQKAKLPLIAIVTETDRRFLNTLERLGVMVVEQKSIGMGKIRREALVNACSLFPKATHYCWLEPEKPDIVRFFKPISELMLKERSVLGLFNRVSMQSYPSEQAYYYLFCRAVASKLIGFDIDYAFGSMVISKEGVRYFLEYKGEYGDKWDAILIPRLRAIKEGSGISILPINFQNDPRMTKVESGNPVMIMKRLEQLNNVIPSLIREWEKLSRI